MGWGGVGWGRRSVKVFFLLILYVLLQFTSSACQVYMYYMAALLVLSVKVTPVGVMSVAIYF